MAGCLLFKPKARAARTAENGRHGQTMATIDFGDLDPSTEERTAFEQIAQALPADWRMLFSQSASKPSNSEIVLEGPAVGPLKMAFADGQFTSPLTYLQEIEAAHRRGVLH